MTAPAPRWRIASLRLSAIAEAQEADKLGHQVHGAVQDMPPSTSSTVCFDRDGVLILEMRSYRHDGQGGIDAAMKDIEPQLRQLGWTRSAAPNQGTFDHCRADGACSLPGAWSTWVREETP